jgi:polysaccharide biosynthesis transport protein
VDIRSYLSIARRQRWVIIEAVVVVALLAALFSASQPSTYRATARVLLRADDLNEADSNAYYYDADRYVAIQSDIVKSRAVLDTAAEDLGRDSSAGLAQKVSVAQKAATDILEISATDRRPEAARDIANGVANAYIDNRTEDALGNLEAVAAQLDEQLAALRSQIGDYDAQISQRAAEAAITGGAVRDDVLEAAREAASLQYQTVFGRQQELQVDIGLKRAGATLLAEAGTPRVPTGSGPLRSGVIGGVVGLLLEQLDDRAKNRAELERATNLPVLAELPVDPPSAKGSFLATRDAPLSPLAEATRSLRTSLHFLGVDEPLRRIVVTSASPGEGKSVVAANIAVAYAQAGFRTVLVSADLRRPGVERLFDVPPNARGLSDLIADAGGRLVPAAVGGPREPQGRNGNGRTTAFAARPQDALVPTAEPNLRLLPAGSVPPNASELLASPHATEILDALGAEADVVVLDTPPTLPVTDAAVLAAKSDGVVLVAVPGETMRSAAARAHETLDTPQVRLLGLVLNKSREAGRSAYRYGNDAAGPATKRRRGPMLVRTGTPDS